MYRKYKRYYRHSRKPDILDMVAESIIGIGTFIGWLIFKIFKKILKKRSKINTFSPSESLYIPAEKEENIDNKELYSLRGSLLTPTEKDFLKALEKTVGNRYHIELQVQLSRIVSPIDISEHFVNYRAFNRIKAKSIDFVLYDNNYKPHLAIELDDHSHSRPDRIERDRFVDEVMNSVGLKIIHIPIAQSYDLAELAEKIS